jgi:hypothetical protein
MKRKVIASVLGIIGSVAMVASSFGQGSVVFANYTTASGSGPTADPGVNAPVTFGTTINTGGINATAGNRIGSEFTAALLYSLNGGSTFSLLTQAQAGDPGYPTAFLGVDGQNATAAGYFQGPGVTIPGYSSGPITFIVQAYNGSSYSAGNTTWNGQSAAFTLNSIATGLNPPSDFGQVGGTGGFLQSFAVNPVPEPTVFALAGLGAAALMIVRRKK